MKQWQAVNGNFDEIFAGTSRGFFFVDVKYGTAAGATEKVNIQSGSWSFDYETSAQRPHNVGTHLMGTPHNIHATSAHNEHLTHRWRTQRPHNVHATSTQRWHNIHAQSAHRLATSRHFQSVH